MSEEKVAIVTGGGRGIGRAISIELAKDGYYIIVNYKSNENSAIETLDMIKSEGGDGEIIQFNVVNADDTKKCIEEITSRFNNIEVLINNAGIIADGLFLMLHDNEWDSVIDTTLKGFYNITKPVLKKMIRKRRGSIVSISSVAALYPNRGQSNYAAAKAGLIGASRAISTEVARIGIRVNVVAPGLIDTEMIKDAPIDAITEMIPMKRIGKPEEVAKMVRFLCSDDASYITGQVISVNGGMF
ncbi:MAG: 3-oxoacyl-ACP reductase FabG [Spirochaetota bacterium]|nr:3-oxoacyl-ACP reductase FabG [Spirochaetota bacterium]